MIPENFRPTQKAVSLSEDFAIGLNERDETLCLVKLKDVGIFRKNILIDKYQIFRGG